MWTQSIVEAATSSAPAILTCRDAAGVPLGVVALLYDVRQVMARHRPPDDAPQTCPTCFTCWPCRPYQQAVEIRREHGDPPESAS